MSRRPQVSVTGISFLDLEGKVLRYVHPATGRPVMGISWLVLRSAKWHYVTLVSASAVEEQLLITVKRWIAKGEFVVCAEPIVAAELLMRMRDGSAVA